MTFNVKVSRFDLVYFYHVRNIMSISHSSTLKDRGVEIKISTLHNKKFQSSVCYIEFDTSQKSLLSLLLNKFVCEKCVNAGATCTTQILSAIPGQTSIALIVPENKLTQNIQVLYGYLQKTKLTSQQAKLCTDGNYKTLANDLKHFEVTITGKCKNFTAALSNKAPKIDRLIKSLGAIEPNGNREACGNGQKGEETSVEFEGGDDIQTTMMYASVFMGNVPCTISKSGSNVKITLLAGGGPCILKQLLLFKDALQGKVKGFLGQSGACGSPSANDKDKSKYNEKVKGILACQNELAAIYSGVRGFKFSFKNKEELKKVNSDSISKVKGMKVK